MDVSGFLGSFYGKDGEQKKDVKNFCSGKILMQVSITCAVTPTNLLRLHELLRCMGSGSAADRR